MENRTLHNNLPIPSIGFGVFQIENDGKTKEAVFNAIKAGYRLIDTAAAYRNEEEVGAAIKEAIKEGIVTREELFVTSKLWVSDVNEKRAGLAIKESLQRLGLDYLDLMLIHQPYNDVFGAWRVMQDAYKQGLVKSIGVSNFYVDQLTNLAEFNEIKPMVEQIEVNPFCQNSEKVKYLQEYGIQVEAWAPFAEGKHDLFKNKLLQSIADSNNKSIAQVVLRWLYQRDIVPLPKSVTSSRMEENLSIFDFSLTEEEMESIKSLDRKESQFVDQRAPETIISMSKWTY
ncbi:aldo/keto reductase [Apilactobacillus kunkeei]|uniref:Aldo/keto reductase n=1 Tax=Apilactobacillus kunkeei TaxID=148814 RepID=A0A0M9DFX2_9LACO|nr:aldo/keto reductase [Apilactobacillus kunkeei]KOY79767.1 Aldo/keto reductase [Apilactobacillus kunkeei]